jgi:hypothetical protein
MTAFNNVYYNAALSAFIASCVASQVTSGPYQAATPTFATIVAQFVPAAQAFASAVDAAISAGSFSGSYDPHVSSADGTTVVPSTAAEANALSTRPLMVGQFCRSALGANASADNGLQGSGTTAHTPVAGDYAVIASQVAQSFAAYITSGVEATG